ncbi:hypothetical protein [Aureivirga sp. CE67]|uniref:hypothetical protein n=1 Tax=Aureivirga sp. CE67 TaxID=1788983 RepID=UPI0018CAB2AC|nr:hypothetical protein [Aureivirga sp. CE67]
MKKGLLILAIAFTAISCGSDKTDTSKRFRTGTFEVPAGENHDKFTFVRKDSLQIENYNGVIDTLVIHWEDDFNYTAKYLHPKKSIEKETFHFRITGVKKDSYTYRFKIGNSNFNQEGTVMKIKN